MSDDVSTIGYDLLTPVRPAEFGALLAPVDPTLTHLQFEATDVKFKSHDGSRIDLSAFRSLRHLVTSGSLLFGDGALAANYPGALADPTPLPLWRALPPCLDVLKITFDRQQGVFWSMFEMRTAAQQPESPSDFAHTQRACRHDEFCFGWLIDLLAAAAGGKAEPGKEGGSGDENAAFIPNFVFVVEAEVGDRDRDW